MSDNQNIKNMWRNGSLSIVNKDYADKKDLLIYLKITRGTNTNRPS